MAPHAKGSRGLATTTPGDTASLVPQDTASSVLIPQDMLVFALGFGLSFAIAPALSLRLGTPVFTIHLLLGLLT